jgi:hypothetical protein
MTPRRFRLTITGMARVLDEIITGNGTFDDDEEEEARKVLFEILMQLHAEHPGANERELTRLLFREVAERIPRPKKPLL